MNSPNPIEDDSESIFVRIEATPSMTRGSFCLPSNMAAASYLRFLGEKRADAIDVPSLERINGDVAEDEDPFLSVVIRTQGKRIEELTDVLLCLAGQQDDDFEVIVVGHCVASEQAPILKELLASFPATLTRRMKYCQVDYGTRTTPLRVGFAAARGAYVSVLDDDDLVMDTWTATFKELAEHNMGKMLHAFAVTQEWGGRSTDQAHHRELYAESGFGAPYCHPFSVASQMSVNSCPLMSLAFPRYVFDQLGMDFDETLTTMEDWDFLMRVYSACGAASKAVVTSIYRLWTNTETSHTQHNAREWDNNYKKIINKMSGRPYLLDQGGVEDVRAHNSQSAVSREALLQSALLVPYAHARSERKLWEDIGELRAEHAKDPEVTAVRPIYAEEDDWDISFELDSSQAISTLMFSPIRAPFKVLGEFSLRLVDASGAERVIDFADSSVHNGYQVDCNHIVYLKENPFVAFAFSQPLFLQRVDLSFKLMASVADYYIDQVTLGNYGLKLGRARRWLGRRMHRNG